MADSLLGDNDRIHRWQSDPKRKISEDISRVWFALEESSNSNLYEWEIQHARELLKEGGGISKALLDLLMFPELQDKWARVYGKSDGGIIYLPS